jgi:hypothetical protein
MLTAPTVGDGTQQRSLVNQVVLTFDGTVQIAAGAFTLTKRGPGGGNVTLNTPTITTVGNQTFVTLTFSGSFTRGTMKALLDGYYQLTIDGSKLTRAGQQLDTNSDGVGGDLYQFGDDEFDRFFALYGDTNGDGLVGMAEYAQFQSAFGKTPSSFGYNILLDYDGLGIGVSDFAQFRNRLNKPKLAWV